MQVSHARWDEPCACGSCDTCQWWAARFEGSKRFACWRCKGSSHRKSWPTFSDRSLAPWQCRQASHFFTTANQPTYERYLIDGRCHLNIPPYMKVLQRIESQIYDLDELLCASHYLVDSTLMTPELNHRWLCLLPADTCWKCWTSTASWWLLMWIFILMCSPLRWSCWGLTIFSMPATEPALTAESSTDTRFTAWSDAIKKQKAEVGFKGRKADTDFFQVEIRLTLYVHCPLQHAAYEDGWVLIAMSLFGLSELGRE